MHERSQVLIVAYNLEAPLKATPFLMTSHSIRTEEVGLLVTAPASVSDALKWANGWQLRQRPAAVHESSRDLYRVLVQSIHPFLASISECGRTGFDATSLVRIPERTQANSPEATDVPCFAAASLP